ncbi:TerS protein [uncultured Limnobacter sp.]|uniref:TerS protein n=1 Tax=uncultured Limnobacter sp. TaxID=199681 RepID=UPI0030FA82A3
MTKKKPSNSASAAIDAALNAAKPLPELPKHVNLRPEDFPFWENILRARARDEWTEVDLVVAAQLARCQYDIEKESLALDSEGSVVDNQRGTKVMNPRHAVLEQLARREMAIMRSLRLTGSSTGDTRDLEKARKLQRQAEAARNEVTEDDLLA